MKKIILLIAFVLATIQANAATRTVAVDETGALSDQKHDGLFTNLFSVNIGLLTNSLNAAGYTSGGGSGTVTHTVGSLTANLPVIGNGGADVNVTNTAAFKGLLSLDQVDNTADTDKPISTAQQSALDLKAPLASPTFTGSALYPLGSAAVPALANSTYTGNGLFWYESAASGRTNLAFADNSKPGLWLDILSGTGDTTAYIYGSGGVGADANLRLWTSSNGSSSRMYMIGGAAGSEEGWVFNRGSAASSYLLNLYSIDLGYALTLSTNGYVAVNKQTAASTALDVNGTVTATAFVGNAASATVDASGFSGNLTTSDDTLQEIANAVDGLSTGAGTPANPTASVGTSAVNGSASTYMRSDAAPAIDQGITPTWTGAHHFDSANADKLILNAWRPATVAGAGTLQLVDTTNRTEAVFSGSTASVQLPATMTHDFHLVGVSTYNSGSQIITIKDSGGTAITATPVLGRGYTTQTITNAAATDGKFELVGVVTNGVLDHIKLAGDAWLQPVDLTSEVTGTLPAANGGTGIASLGSGVPTALGVNTGSAGAFVVNGGALGTPSSGTLTSATGLPISTGVSGLGTGVAIALGSAVNTSGGLATSANPAFSGTATTVAMTGGSFTSTNGFTDLSLTTNRLVFISDGGRQYTIANGTSGQVLTATGSFPPASFQDAAAGGGGGFSTNLTSFTEQTLMHGEDELLGNITSSSASLNLSVGASGGSINGLTYTNHPGVVGLSTGTSATGAAYIYSGITSWEFGNGEAGCVWIAMTPSAVSDGTDTYTLRIGWNDNLTGDSTDGAYFRYTDSVNSGKWQAVVRGGSTETAADTGVTMTASTWRKFAIYIDAASSSAIFLIDGTVVATITDANVPTTGEYSRLYAGVVKSAGTNVRQLQADYVRWWKVVSR